MRKLIIISIFLTVFSLLGYYVYSRFSDAFKGTFLDSNAVLALYIFLIASFIVGKIMESTSINVISSSLVRIGSVSLGFFLYAFLIVIFVDFIRLINYIIPFYPKFITENLQLTKLAVGITSFVIVFAIFITGYFNARTPKIKNTDIKINKKSDNLNCINIVAVSDIHLGTMVNERKARQLVDKINELEPDLVIIAGDIIDDNIEVVKYFKLLENFQNLKSKYGVYACPGNHEYISQAYKEYDFFEKNGIKVLNDEAILIENKFYIIGRDDTQGKSFNKKERKTLQELTENIDVKLPIILLDHQPYKLDETAKYPIDLQFSGHTHRGQIFPFNLITKRIFEKDYGYLKKENTHFYISSGYGTAVMPIRVLSKSEIVKIKLQF